MSQVNQYTNHPLTAFQSSVQYLISVSAAKYSETIKSLASFGKTAKNGAKNNNDDNQEEFSENRYSLLYLLNDQYHHVGYPTQAKAQNAMGMLMTDENRIPMGIYDSKTDTFEWEIIGQYLHSQDPIEEQESRLAEILQVSRALRRRDASWQPGYLQKPSIFA